MTRDSHVSTDDLVQPGGVRQQERPESTGGEGPAGVSGEGSTAQDTRGTESTGGRGVEFDGNTAAGEPTQRIDPVGAYQDDRAQGGGTATRDDRAQGGGTATRDDRASAGRAAMDDRASAGRASATGTDGDGGQGAASDGGTGGDLALLDRSDETSFRQRWSDVQARFVDDPQDAVHTADALVAELMQSLARGFSEHKGRLEAQWQSGGTPDTEELRQALQHYRSFFDRLLST